VGSVLPLAPKGEKQNPSNIYGLPLGRGVWDRSYPRPLKGGNKNSARLTLGRGSVLPLSPKGGNKNFARLTLGRGMAPFPVYRQLLLFP